MMRMWLITRCQRAPNICSVYAMTHSEYSVLRANNCDLAIFDLSLSFYAPKLWFHCMVLEEERHKVKLYQWTRDWVVTIKVLWIQLLQFKGLWVTMMLWAKKHFNTFVLSETQWKLLSENFSPLSFPILFIHICTL